MIAPPHGREHRRRRLIFDVFGVIVGGDNDLCRMGAVVFAIVVAVAPGGVGGGRLMRRRWERECRIFFREVCHNNAYPEIVFFITAQKNVYFILSH